MSAKITVIGENRHIKRTLALTLVLKQVYDWHVYMSSVKRRPVSDYKSILAKNVAPKVRTKYQHHIEPKLERLTQLELERQVDMDYLRFLRSSHFPKGDWERQSTEGQV